MTQPPFISSLTVALGDQMAWASARIRSYCGWHISPSITDTLVLDSDGGRLLMLPTLYLTGITSITGPDGLIDAADYEWSATGQVRGCWPCGFRSVTAVFTHGYDDTPDEIAEVTVGVAKRMPAQMASVSQEAAGGVSRSYGGLLSGTAALSAGWTMSEQMVLDKYRLPSLP